MVSFLRREVSNLVLNRLFTLWERLGFHITKNNFYQPIPDTRLLAEHLWTRQSDLIGIDMREESQLGLLSQFATLYKKEYDQFPIEDTGKPY